MRPRCPRPGPSSRPCCCARTCEPGPAKAMPKGLARRAHRAKVRRRGPVLAFPSATPDQSSAQCREYRSPSSPCRHTSPRLEPPPCPNCSSHLSPQRIDRPARRSTRNHHEHRQSGGVPVGQKARSRPRAGQHALTVLQSLLCPLVGPLGDGAPPVKVLPPPASGAPPTRSGRRSLSMGQAGSRHSPLVPRLAALPRPLGGSLMRGPGS